MTLNTNNPFDQPAIDSGILTSPFDIYAFKEGIAAQRRFFSAPTWAEYKLSLAVPVPEDDEDEALTAFLREAVTGYGAHPVGTASMSPRGAQWGVVDPDLKVKKVRGLRVADASVMVSRTADCLVMPRPNMLHSAIYHLWTYPSAGLCNC